MSTFFWKFVIINQNCIKKQGFFITIYNVLLNEFETSVFNGATEVSIAEDLIYLAGYLS